MPAADFDDNSQYRMSSCSICGIKERYNRLHILDIKETSGYSTSKRSSRTHYKYVKKRLCQDCYDSYRRGQRYKFLFYAVIAVGIAVFAMNSKQQTPSRPDSATQPDARSTSEPQGQTDPLRPQSEQPVEQVPAPQDASPPVAIPQAEQPLNQAAPAQEVAPEQVMTVTYYANVRSAPNNGPIVGQVYPGDQLAIVQSQGSWAQVRRGNDVIGWVHRSLLAPLR